MKVSIKNLHITFKGEGEPLDSRLMGAIERQSANAGDLATALNKAQHELNRAKSDVTRLTESNRFLDAELINVRGMNQRMADELAQIAAWVKGYDEGEWPDHNAEGCGPIAKEVLHMLRDFQADIESRPLLGIGRWTDTPPAPVQPNYNADPVGLGQPVPETAQTQPAAPESAMPEPATALIVPTARKCPGFNCSNDLLMEQTYCMAEDCAASHNARFPQVPSLPPKETFDIRAALAAKESFGEPGPLLNNEAKTAEQKALSALLPPCKHAGCDEPTQPGRNFCQEHRKPSMR